MADLTATLLDPTFFPGRAAKILYRPKGNPPFSESQMSQTPSSPESSKQDAPPGLLSSVKEAVSAAISKAKPTDVEIGVIGILHPTVVEKFEIPYPCSALEFTLEPFMKEVPHIWADDA